MTTVELKSLLEAHLADLADETDRTKAAIRALNGHRKPGRPSGD